MNLLYQDTEKCFFQNRHNEFKGSFSQENDLFLCNDVCSDVETFRLQHDLLSGICLLTLPMLA